MTIKITNNDLQRAMFGVMQILELKKGVTASQKFTFISLDILIRPLVTTYEELMGGINQNLSETAPSEKAGKLKELQELQKKKVTIDWKQEIPKSWFEEGVLLDEVSGNTLAGIYPFIAKDKK